MESGESHASSEQQHLHRKTASLINRLFQRAGFDFSNDIVDFSSIPLEKSKLTEWVAGKSSSSTSIVDFVSTCYAALAASHLYPGAAFVPQLFYPLLSKQIYLLQQIAYRTVGIRSASETPKPWLICAKELQDALLLLQSSFKLALPAAKTNEFLSRHFNDEEVELPMNALESIRGLHVIGSTHLIYNEFVDGLQRTLEKIDSALIVSRDTLRKPHLNLPLATEKWQKHSSVMMSLNSMLHERVLALIPVGCIHSAILTDSVVGFSNKLMRFLQSSAEWRYLRGRERASEADAHALLFAIDAVSISVIELIEQKNPDFSGALPVPPEYDQYNWSLGVQTPAPFIATAFQDLPSIEETQPIAENSEENSSEIESKKPQFLTRSQQSCMAHLSSFYHANRKENWEILPVRPRFCPLIVGPSGVGKSHLIRAFGATVSAPVLRLTFGDWLPVGAITGLNTIYQVYDFVNEHATGIIHIDELEKVGNLYDATSWVRSVLVELINILDGNLVIDDTGFSGQKDRVTTKAFTEKMKKHFMVVGSGAWQYLWEDKLKQGAGFRLPLSSTTSEGIQSTMLKDQLLPTEILRRFNSKFLVLEPLEIEDAQRVIELMRDGGFASSSSDSELAQQALGSGQNMRFFEEFVAEQLRLKHCKDIASD